MAGPAPKSRLWTARENTHKPTGLHLIVGGQVEVNYHVAPVLTETKGGGRTLALDLTLEEQKAEPVTDEAGNVLRMPPVWKAVSFHRLVDADQFRAVAIRWDSATMATTPVIDDRERAALMAKQTKAQNVAAGAKQVAATAKKVASGATKKVRKAAKKAAAKTPAKKTKKKARKASTKAPGKILKMIRKAVKRLRPKAGRKKKGRR
jgi:hypothetical protein